MLQLLQEKNPENPSLNLHHLHSCGNNNGCFLRGIKNQPPGGVVAEGRGVSMATRHVSHRLEELVCDKIKQVFLSAVGGDRNSSKGGLFIITRFV